MIRLHLRIIRCSRRHAQHPVLRILLPATCLTFCLCLAADARLGAQQAPAFSVAAVTTGGGVEDVAVADLNNDGLPDIVVADFHSRTALVLLGQRGGGLLRSAAVGLSGTPSRLAVADFDKDGAMDLAIALWSEQGDGSVAFLRGDGQGRFAFHHAMPTGTAAAMVAADVDRDGYSDVVLSLPFRSRVSVLYGRAGFSWASTLHIDAGVNPAGLAVADFNGDGRTDIVVSNHINGASTVALLIATATRQFSVWRSPPSALSAATLAVADLNQDGKTDVAAADASSAAVALFFGTGTGQLLTPRLVRVAEAPSSALSVVDVNGDGFADIASAHFSIGSATLSMGAGGGSFQPALTLVQMPGAWRVVAGDVNSDGRNDLVVARRSGDPELALLQNAGLQSGLCATPQPVAGWICVNGGWVPPDHPAVHTIAITASTTIPSPSSTTSCPGMPPMAGWVCVNGGWVPADHPLAQTAAPALAVTTTSSPSQTSTAACSGTAPAAGWVCVNGGWVPADHPLAQTAAPTTAPPPASPTSVPPAPVSSPPAAVSCSGTAPSTGWVCVNGGWVPPDHPLAQTAASATASSPATTATPLPSPTSTSCSGPAPSAGWVCINGGWVPPDHPLAVATTGTTAPLQPVATTGSTGSLGSSPPRYVAFVASSDHATNVFRYVLKVFASTANPATAAPLAISDLGKPAPSSSREIIVDRATFFGGLATGSYRAIVTAVGPGGETPSASVLFTR